MKRLSLTVLAAALTLLSGCASIIHGPSQEVEISSNPSNATVTSNGRMLGQTPVTATLARKDEHVIKIELDGYTTYETTLTRTTSGWFWGNIILGGLIGCAIDVVTGSFYKLTPEQVNAELSEGNARVETDTDGLYVFVTLEPKASWELIGQLATD
ncbi:MAG: PEGA domain-containing protein [Pseudomonadota bacterium]|mgnify:CR=1 FL=1